MDNATHLGLDVHKDTIAVAILRPGDAEPDERTIRVAAGYWTQRRLSRIPHWGGTWTFSVRAEKAYAETGFVRGAHMASSTSWCSISLHALFEAAGSVAWSRCASRRQSDREPREGGRACVAA